MASASKRRSRHSSAAASAARPPLPLSAAARALKVSPTRSPSAAAADNLSNPASSSAFPHFDLSPEDIAFGGASHLARSELLRRRTHRLRQLRRCYRDHYWLFMEELKARYHVYYWRFGASPFMEDRCWRGPESGADGGNYNNRCLFVGCKFKAMALTRFCHMHILSDTKQTLYKPCGYVIKSSQAGPITCGKPILSSASPPLCSAHFQKAQKHMTRALKKAGVNLSSASKFASKFHVIVADENGAEGKWSLC